MLSQRQEPRRLRSSVVVSTAVSTGVTWTHTAALTSTSRPRRSISHLRRSSSPRRRTRSTRRRRRIRLTSSSRPAAIQTRRATSRMRTNYPPPDDAGSRRLRRRRRARVRARGASRAVLRGGPAGAGLWLRLDRRLLELGRRPLVLVARPLGPPASELHLRSAVLPLGQRRYVYVRPALAATAAGCRAPSSCAITAPTAARRPPSGSRRTPTSSRRVRRRRTRSTARA